MEQLQFGVSSMNLGASAAGQGDIGLYSGHWEGAASIPQFYRAGGHPIPASDTECQFLWNEENLYIRFICKEAERVEYKGVGRDKKKLMSRKDAVEAAVSSGCFGHRDFSVFRADTTGETSARTQHNMTYLGGDQAYIGGRCRIENQARITEIAKDSYKCVVETDKGKWMALFRIPWVLVGGLPEDSFHLQVYRKRHQTSEICSPYPLDLQVNFSDRFEYDPLTFLEVSLNGEAGVSSAESVLFTLPSGTWRWQRPVKLVWPSKEERLKIEALRTCGTLTDADNFADRVYLVQRWQDTLTLEGMDHFTGQSVTYPWEFKEPWVQRRLCNEALSKGDFGEARKVLDTTIDYFNMLTKWWYADHTFGNCAAESWRSLGTMTRIFQTGNEINFEFRESSGGDSDNTDRNLVLHCTASAGGFHFYLDQKGYFQGEEEFITLLQNDTGAVIRTEFGVLEVKSGPQWEIRQAESPFCFNNGSIAVLQGENGREGFELKLPFDDKEGVYGFGECFDDMNQAGYIRTLWQRDACEGCLASIGNQSYKNIPLIHLTEGYSLFLNSHYRIRADVGNEVKGQLRLNIAGPGTDFYVWCRQPAEVMDCYTRLTGRPILPPQWVFEPWAGGGAGRWYLGPLKDLCKEQIAVLEQFEELDIPHSGFYAEGAGAEWFQNPKYEELYKIAAYGEKKGIRVFSWQNPDMSLEAAEKWLPGVPQEDLPVNRVASHEGEKKLPTYIDFTHPGGMDLLRAQWKVRLDAGIRGTMVDFGDFVPEEAVFYDGRGGGEMHNAYAYEYAKGYRQLFYEKYGEDHVLYTRSAAAGSQAFACQFGGDQYTSFLGMRYSIHGGITAGASGLPFWGVDAAGYDGFADEETYIRWTQWACFCPIMRYHGTNPREPWEYSDEAVQTYRFYAWLRENILPYSYGAAVTAHKTGLPMMRPLVMEFPEQRELADCDDEYLYGSELLVAPVYEEGNSRVVTFPKGRWVSLWDNREVVEGPADAAVEAPLEVIPVYLREGAFLPLCLNGNLKLGESMTAGRKEVLMLTAPDTVREGRWYQNGTDAIEYQLSPSDKGFVFRCKGTGEWSYYLIRGLSRKPDCITVNGRKYPEFPVRTALYFDEGWCREQDGTIIVRVFDHSETELSLIMQ